MIKYQLCTDDESQLCETYQQLNRNLSANLITGFVLSGSKVMPLIIQNYGSTNWMNLLWIHYSNYQQNYCGNLFWSPNIGQKFRL